MASVQGCVQSGRALKGNINTRIFGLTLLIADDFASMKKLHFGDEMLNN